MLLRSLCSTLIPWLMTTAGHAPTASLTRIAAKRQSSGRPGAWDNEEGLTSNFYMVVSNNLYGCAMTFWAACGRLD